MACCSPTSKEPSQDFHPDYYTQCLTEKFYARHECLAPSQTKRVTFYENEIQKMHDYNPRDYYCTPRFTNQCYGWLKGDFIMRWQACSIDKNPLVLEILRGYFATYPKRMQRLPGQSLYCRCKMAQPDDHWKIV